MPDLGITHQPFLEPDSQPVSLELDVVVRITDRVHRGGRTVEDGVTVFVRGETPSVVDAVGER